MTNKPDGRELRGKELIQTALERGVHPEEWIKFLAWAESSFRAEGDRELVDAIREWRLEHQLADSPPPSSPS